MTKPSSSNASANSCANSADKPTLEEIARIIDRLREAGAKVINERGDDLGPADIEALVKEFFR
jgi:hypothetical protein